VNPCDICELERLMRDRSDELRTALKGMNPTVDRDWDATFAALAGVDNTRRLLAADREHA
jgi:hypothetical protein